MYWLTREALVASSWRSLETLPGLAGPVLRTNLVEEELLHCHGCSASLGSHAPSGCAFHSARGTSRRGMQFRAVPEKWMHEHEHGDDNHDIAILSLLSGQPLIGTALTISVTALRSTLSSTCLRVRVGGAHLSSSSLRLVFRSTTTHECSARGRETVATSSPSNYAACLSPLSRVCAGSGTDTPH